MHASFPKAVAALATCAAFVLTGCEEFFDRGSKRAHETGDAKAKAGEVQAAIRHYEMALDGTGKTAEVHYKLALLYADKLKSPIDAMHHFDRYLDLAPSGTHVKEAKAYRKEGEAKLLAGLSKNNPLTQEDAARLKNDNLALRKALVDLRAQKNATPPPTPPGMKKGEQVQKPIPANARTHTVQKGETLGTIAQRYYKSKARWKDIQDANFYSLEGTAKIKPGMQLIIP
jgi:LysM repeat protein